MLIDMPVTSSAIDSSGERLHLEGLDISDFNEGKAFLNFEHKNDAESIIGIFKSVKKIYSIDDCETDRQKMFWNQIKLPFLYGIAELFDKEENPGAVAVASMLRYFKSKGEKIQIGASIEGATLERKGSELLRTIGRKCAITLRPCNKTCWVDMIEDTEYNINKNEPCGLGNSLQVIEVESAIIDSADYSSDPVSELKLALETLQKTLTAGMGNAAPGCLTGGAALTKEHLSPTVKNTLKAAIRDWNRVRPLKEVIKAALPEVSDKYVDHFTQIAEDLALKKGMNPKLIRISKNHSIHPFDTDEQKQLIEGTFFDPHKRFNPETFPSNILHIGQNDAGDEVLIKKRPANPVTEDHDPINEAMYYNLAKNVFGMQDHVPVSAAISHPLVHEEPVTLVKYHRNFKSPFSDPDAFHAALQKGREDGSLHKMTLMDMILHNGDRHLGNILVSPDGKLQSIDHEYPFQYHNKLRFEHAAPDQIGDKQYPGILNDHPHIEAGRWLQGIDKKRLVRELAKYGLGRDILKTSLARLKLLQLMTNKGATIGNMLDAINGSRGINA